MQNHSSSTHEALWLEELRAFSQHSRILQKWRPVSYLDKGQFSRIFKAVNCETGAEAVLKFVPNPREVEDCRPAGDAAEKSHRDQFEISKREVQIMHRLCGEGGTVQYLEEPEFLKRTFLNARGETVVQYAVLICMPLYQNHREWIPQVAGNRKLSLQLGMDIAQALMLFERKGIFHRDIKPGNILRDADGSFCLGDVGESKLESESTTFGYHGTPSYMAPEVYNLEYKRIKTRSDHRSDIYSLGIVLYKLFNQQQFPFLSEDGTLTEEAGRSFRQYEKENAYEAGAFLSDSQRATLLRYEGKSLPPPAQADDELSRVILRACAYDKQERYQTAEELHADLLRCLKSPDAKRTADSQSSRQRGCMKMVIWASLMVVLSILILVVGAMRKPPPPPPPPSGDGPVCTSDPAPAFTQSPVPIAATAVLTERPVVVQPSLQETTSASVIRRADGLVLERTREDEWKIIDYTGEATNLVLPDEIDGCPVTAIGDSAFYMNNQLEAVWLGEHIRTIDSWCFSKCANLKKVQLPDGLEEIGLSAFDTCSSLKEIHIPDGVAEIEYGSFFECTSLEKVHFPSSLTSIADYAFTGCTSLRSIDLPVGLVAIGEEAFMFCELLEEVTLPDGLLVIAGGAFSYCSNLHQIILPASVISVSEYAFDRCADDFVCVTREVSGEEAKDGSKTDLESATDHIRGWDAETQEYQYVCFGAYPQTSEAESPILWRVLSRDDNCLLLLSEYVLTSRRFDDRSSDWRRSDLRAWLNENFVDDAFGRSGLRSALIPNENDTVFLLSAEDYRRSEYGFSSSKDVCDENRLAVGTDRAIQTGLWLSQTRNCTYYTRSADEKASVKQVRNDGTLGVAKCTRTNVGVRPAVLLDLTSVEIVSGVGTKNAPYMLNSRK